MAEKAQFMISVPQVTRDRMDALRVVMVVSRAEIGRLALESDPGGLVALEKAHGERIERLRALAVQYGYPNWNTLVWWLNRRYGQKMPLLEELEDRKLGLIARHSRVPRQAAAPAEPIEREPEVPEVVSPTFSG